MTSLPSVSQFDRQKYDDGTDFIMMIMMMMIIIIKEEEEKLKGGRTNTFDSSIESTSKRFETDDFTDCLTASGCYDKTSGTFEMKVKFSELVNCKKLMLSKIITDIFPNTTTHLANSHATIHIHSIHISNSQENVFKENL